MSICAPSIRPREFWVILAPIAGLVWAGSARGQTLAARPEPPAQIRRESPPPSWLVPSLHGLGVITGMRLGAAVLWPEPFADTSWTRTRRSYADAYTHWPRWDSSQPAFEWDGDDWTINVLGHGLFGSELYMRARICRHSMLEALAFTAVGSAVWEYGFEASAVRPSALDLTYTPISGMVLGEARYQGWLAASRISDAGWRAALTAVFDPFGELERLLGTAC